MKTYDDKHIKNVAIVGAAKSGKTTLAETMLFEAGIITRRGTTEERNTVSDYHEIEQERQGSVYATLLHTEWRDYKINLVDTPGLDDFIGEVIAAMNVCDTSVMLLNAQHGLEVGTELVWRYVDAFRKPVIFAVNQMDHEKADWEKTIEEGKKRFGAPFVLMQYPLNTGSEFDSIIDLLKMTMYKFKPAGGKPEKLPIPESEMARATQLHNELVEKAAENDDKLMELFFEKGTLDEDELRMGIKQGMMKHDMFPVFCLSAKNNMGSGRLMGFIDNVAPSAAEMPATKLEGGGELNCDPKGEPVLFVFKSLIEPHLGNMSLFKVCSGEVSAGTELYNARNRNAEKLNQLFIIDGKNRNPINKLVAGDIGATLKLKDTQTCDTLHPKNSDLVVEKIHFPSPRIKQAIVPVNKNDEEKMSEAIHTIHKEDPTITYEFSRELRQQIVGAQGELHLQALKWRMNHIYKIDIEYLKPRIPYRETIRKDAKANYRHRKQSGGAGQFGEVHLYIEPFVEGKPNAHGYTIRGTEEIPLEWGGKLVYLNCIVGGAIDTRFLPSIQKGVMEKMHEGPLTGSYVRDIKVYVYDGKMHDVDSNDMAFKIAGMMAFREAFHAANPQILEPIYNLEVMVPEEQMGDVMSDLQTRRSIIMGMDSDKGYQIIKARVPLAEMDRYSTSLRSLTQGRATFTMEFADYEPVPAEVQKKLSEEYAKEHEKVAMAH